MTAEIVALALIGWLVLSALAGPWVLRRAAPALMHVPRTAVGLISGAAIVWVAAMLALGPMLAWVVSGPAVLPAAAAEVCRQCLAAANPFGFTPVDTVIPVVALLAVPAIAAVLHVVSMIAEARRRRRGTLAAARDLRARSTRREIDGLSVLVVDDAHPFALTLPRALGGVAISSGALDVLADNERAAVLAHESAHLRQRHHLIAAVVAVLTRRLRWVPLLAAAEDALGHYLEIAADDAARRRTGTRALAGALLALAEAGRPSLADPRFSGALHALGPDRVRHLVEPRSSVAGVASAIACACCLTALVLLSASVHIPYALAALTGCV